MLMSDDLFLFDPLFASWSSDLKEDKMTCIDQFNLQTGESLCMKELMLWDPEPDAVAAASKSHFWH